MSSSNPSTLSKEAISPAFLNVVTITLMYGVIILFYIQQMVKAGPGNRGPDVWMNTLIDAVGISTFTYVLPAAIQNAFLQMDSKVVRCNILLLVSDILYVLVYTLFSPRPLWLNIILCICTIVLVLWTSLMINKVSKFPESGQAERRKMEPEDLDGHPKEESSSQSSENDRII